MNRDYLQPVPAMVFMDPQQTVQKHTLDVQERVKAIIDRDKDEFDKTKQYVLNNMHLLKNEIVPMEIRQVTNCPSHDCMIINDNQLYSYTDVKELIIYIKEKNKGAKDDAAARD